MTADAIIKNPVNSKKLSDYKQTRPKQLHLFEFLSPEDHSYSNTIELYDAIPKYVLRTPSGDKLEPIKRSFRHKKANWDVWLDQGSNLCLTFLLSRNVKQRFDPFFVLMPQKAYLGWSDRIG